MSSGARPRALLPVTLTAIGVVYGDIGTRPLYALRECFFGSHSVPATPENVLGVLSLIIASQALISGAFSLTQQAIQLGYAPRLDILHTSHHEMGQVYVPQVNWALMVSTIMIVIGFGSSTALAAAYGIAVTLTMVITALLLHVVAIERWHWPQPLAYAVTGVFLTIDLAFFGANAAHHRPTRRGLTARQRLTRAACCW